MAITQSLDRADLVARLNAHFAILQKTVDHGYQPETDQLHAEIGEQRAICGELINELQDQMNANSYSGAVRRSAAQMLGVPNAILDQQPSHVVADVCSGIARSEIEGLRNSIFRLTETVLPYTPIDPISADRPRQILIAKAPLAANAIAEPLGATLTTVIDHHLISGKSKWTQKTLAAKTRMLGYFIEHIGPDKQIAAIGPDDIRSFKAAIMRLRSNHRVAKAQSFAEKQTANVRHRIAPKTVSNIYDPVRAFFAWATNVEGYISTNPAANVRIEKPKATKGAKARRPFTPEELQQLFAAPVFTGCRSAHFRFQPGTEVHRDDYFWLPILGYYTGARLGELVQLHIRDVIVDGSTTYIEINETLDDGATANEWKHLKSAAAVRKVPIHPDVLALGFGEFVAERRKRKKSVRLFHRVSFGADSQASTVFSKWFARLADKQGLTDPALTYHSFRHGVQDAFRDALQPQYVIDRLFGHSSGTTAGGYGAGVSLKVLADAVEAMQIKVNLPDILPCLAHGD